MSYGLRMTSRERDVQDAFTKWLMSAGWTVKSYNADPWLDIYAERGAERMLAEVKGTTTEPGIDADIAYGQLLRRMPVEDDPDVRLALVVPDWDRAVRAALRVPTRIREALRIDVFAVTGGGEVRLVTGSRQGNQGRIERAAAHDQIGDSMAGGSVRSADGPGGCS